MSGAFTSFATLFVFGAFVAWHTRRLQRLNRAHRDLLSRGRPERGVVRSLDPGFPYRIVYKLGIQLDGRSTTVHTNQLLGEHRLGSLQPGMRVSVRVDPNDDANLVLTETPEALGDGGDGGDAGGDEGGERQVSPGRPLYDPRGVSIVLTLFYVLVLAIPTVFLFLVGGDLLERAFPPEGGFCSAALRCCSALPKDATSVPVWLTGADECAITDADDDEACHFRYTMYRNRAKAAGITCE